METKIEVKTEPEPPAATAAAATAEAGSESQVVRRRATDLAACLACDICTGLLREPYTAPHCMHCFCRQCIDEFVAPGNNMHCPVCKSAGIVTSFGPHPFRDHLRVDLMLTDLLRKVSHQLVGVDMDEAKRTNQWHAMRQQAAEHANNAADAPPKPVKQPALPASGVGCTELFVSAPENYELEQPYMRVHDSVTVDLLSRFIQDRVLSRGSDPLYVRLQCRGQPLAAEQTVGDVAASLWRPASTAGQLLHLRLKWDGNLHQLVPVPAPAPAAEAIAA